MKLRPSKENLVTDTLKLLSMHKWSIFQDSQNLLTKVDMEK